MGLHRQCDGVTRRDALKVGVLGSAAGLTLGSFLQRADAGQVSDRATSKAAIFIELPGGPSHIDTFDLKPNSASEFRGKFNPIKTNVPGIEICEHLPNLAKCADKFAILRGVSHSLGAHPLGQQFVFTGNRPNPSLNYPAYGSVVAKEMPAAADLPSYVSIPRVKQGPGHLGVKYASLQTNATPRKGQPFNVRGITLGNGISLTEVERRQELLKDLDTTFNSIAAQDDLLSGLDKFNQKAYDMITSKRARDAFDVSKEAPSFANMFGEDTFSQSCLLASRLVESGVKFVTVSLGGWDTHSDNFSKLQNDLLPKLDAGLAGLFNGLAAKGLLDTTSVYVSGEFGRTPKINSRSAEGGRDHYPRCMFMLMGGGPIQGGQVIGESDEKAAGPKHEGIKPEDAAATFFHTLGIDHRKEYDTSIGRPISIVRDGDVMQELL
jgi:hypothetical protein